MILKHGFQSVRLIVKKVLEISPYLDPEIALLDIKARCEADSDKPDTCLFLDLNMPKMTGWEFLEVFQDLDEEVKSCFRIYILTSSIEDFSAEKERFPFVAGFISKPLKKDILQEIFSQY